MIDFVFEYKNLVHCIAGELEEYVSKNDNPQIISLLHAIDNRMHEISSLEINSKYCKSIDNVSKKGFGEIWRCHHGGDVNFAINLYFKNKNIKNEINGDEISFSNKIGKLVKAIDRVPCKNGFQNLYTIEKDQTERYKYFFLYDDKMFWGWVSTKLIEEIKFEYENKIAITQKTCYNAYNNKGIYERLSN